MPKLAVTIAVNAVSECAQFMLSPERLQSGTFKLFWIQQCPAQEVGFLLKVAENWLNMHLFQKPAFANILEQ
jgi:hypothetical protein